MRHKFIHIICITLLVTGITACTPGNKNTAEKRYTFNNILDIAYTPDTLHRCYGWVTEAPPPRSPPPAATAGSQMPARGWASLFPRKRIG